MKKSSKVLPEVREQAVRFILEHQREYESPWAAIGSITGKRAAPRKRTERDSGQRGGVSGSEHDRLKALERENRKLKRANEILRRRRLFSLKELDR